MSTISESSSIENFFQFNPQTNLWTVFFHDPANLPIEKIRKSFNQFGTIDSIDRFDGIDGKPLCFINFTTEDAVKRCILQMRSNRFPIHLKRFSFASINSGEAPKSPRRNSRDRGHNNNNNNNKRRINESGGNKGYEAGPRAKGKYEKRGSFNSLNSTRASEDEDKSKGDEEFTEKSGNDNTSITEFDISTGESEFPLDLPPKSGEKEILEVNLQKSTESLKLLENSSAKWDILSKNSEIRSNLTAKNDKKDEILGEKRQNSKESLKILENSSVKFDISTAKSQIRSNLIAKSDKKEEILQENLQNSTESLKILEQTSSPGSTNSLRSSKPSGLPDLVVRTPNMSPVSSPEFYQSPKETIIQHVTAQDVIIANIHEACGINLLQTLLAKYEPLYISRIEVIPKICIRYCHVYFPDEKTAKIVEKAYDKCEINGTELIVIRAKTLASQMDSDY